MEHLDEGRASGFPRVPYVVEHQYDYGGFDSFPDRLGWYLGRGDQWERSRADQTRAEDTVDGFLQAWLFFGLLAEVVKLHPPLDLEEFSVSDDHGSWWITTQHLQRHLEMWKTEIINSNVKSSAQLIRARMILDQAYHYTAKYCSVSGSDDDQIWGTDSIITLSLLVLGETLSYATNVLIETSRQEITGWLKENQMGWGYSKYVVEQMKHDKWCARSVNLLLGLLDRSCIGLLYALHIGDAKELGLAHEKCNVRTCRARERLNFAAGWHPNGDKCSCEHIGPDPRKLSRLIRDMELVVLEYHPQESRIEAVPYRAGMRFVILSHVWADGFGNPEKNTLPVCRLRMFLEVFGRLSRAEQALRAVAHRSQPQSPTLFWIDTLGIPLGTEYSNERRIAIQTMHRMYTLSTYTVVLDAGLITQPRGGTYAETAMRITMSYWITRLWTLQEAYLSKRLLFNFNDALQDMEVLEAMREVRLSSPLSWAARSYYRAILGQERYRVHRFTETEGANPRAREQISPELLTSLWNSLRWRTTSRAEHETLAIATLLRLNTAPFDDVKFTANSGFVDTPGRLEQKMQILLSMIAQNTDRAIPVGLIFLPGPKLSARGFRWAPRCWLNSSEVRSQETISAPQTGAQLTSEGLLFESPGFMLHKLGERASAINELDQIDFPIDNSLRTWVVVSAMEDECHSRSDVDLSRLAVITQEQHPSRNSQTALLVAVTNDRHHTIFAQIIRFVRINFELEAGRNSKRREKWQKELSRAFVGEVLQLNTQWCLDGPEPSTSTQVGSTWSLPNYATWFTGWQIKFSMAEMLR